MIRLFIFSFLLIFIYCKEPKFEVLQYVEDDLGRTGRIIRVLPCNWYVSEFYYRACELDYRLRHSNACIPVLKRVKEEEIYAKEI